MRPFSARLPLLYRSMTAATSSSRVAMLTRLIAISPTPSRPGAFQMRQQLNIREHFWRGNAPAFLIVALHRCTLRLRHPPTAHAGDAGAALRARGALQPLPARLDRGGAR